MVETETKQGHSETNRSYETNGFSRYIQNIYPKTKGYTIFSAPHGTFSKTYYINHQKTGCNRYKYIEIILSNHHGLRLIFNNNINNGKPTFTWKLNNTLLNDTLLKEGIKEEIKDFLKV